ncbi:hypothetical protein S83_032865, partial [Arachis hypogaea]
YTHSICAINFSCNNLSGSIPIELFMLTALEYLYLSHNQLMGMISHDIDNLFIFSWRIESLLQQFWGPNFTRDQLQ